MGWSVNTNHISRLFKTDNASFLILKWKIYQYGNYAKSYLKMNQKRQNWTGASSREPNQGGWWQFFFPSVLRDNTIFLYFYNLLQLRVLLQFKLSENLHFLCLNKTEAMPSVTQARPAGSWDCWGRFALQLRRRLDQRRDNLFCVLPLLQSAKMPPLKTAFVGCHRIKQTSET